MLRTAIALFLFSTLSVTQALAASSLLADPNTRCAKVTSPKSWSYCVTTTPESKSRDVIYYMHGLGGNEKQWSSSEGLGRIRALWAQKGYAVPTVLTISFGPAWFLAEKNSSSYSGLYEFFFSTIMPTLEKEIAFPSGSKRMVIGLSMGGFNAVQMIAKHPELFSATALLCPAISDLSPFASPAEVAQYVKETGAKSDYVSNAFTFARAFFPSQAEYDQSSPLKLADKLSSKKTPRLFISVGRQDEYGFFRGTETFADRTRTLGIPTEWAPVEGGHCAYDPNGVADFFVKSAGASQSLD